ncbi:hypothetical protein P3342_010956 [Pyrenophora teres f. teres]|nr:hypothetical protein P3342_010956 [Pyrenophora teres f. teres]
MNGDSYSRDGGRSSGSRNYSSRDTPRDRDDRGDRRRRRSRSPRHGGGGGGGGGGGSRRDYEVDTYSSSRDYREREREDTYARRERRDDRGERGGERGGWGDSYSRRDRPRDRDRDEDRGHRRERGGERNERGGDRFGGEDRRGGRGGRDGGFGGGRDRMRQQKEESPPFNKPREATPDLASFTNILQRPRRMTQWDIKPAGYENITAEQAKLSGMFPLPGAPRAAPMDPSKLAAFISPSAGTATAAALATSAAKQSKRLYVHNLPPVAPPRRLWNFSTTSSTASMLCLVTTRACQPILRLARSTLHWSSRHLRMRHSLLL